MKFYVKSPYASYYCSLHLLLSVLTICMLLPVFRQLLIFFFLFFVSPSVFLFLSSGFILIFSFWSPEKLPGWMRTINQVVK